MLQQQQHQRLADGNDGDVDGGDDGCCTPTSPPPPPLPMASSSIAAFDEQQPLPFAPMNDAAVGADGVGCEDSSSGRTVTTGGMQMQKLVEDGNSTEQQPFPKVKTETAAAEPVAADQHHLDCQHHFVIHSISGKNAEAKDNDDDDDCGIVGKKPAQHQQQVIEKAASTETDHRHWQQKLERKSRAEAKPVHHRHLAEAETDDIVEKAGEKEQAVQEKVEVEEQEKEEEKKKQADDCCCSSNNSSGNDQRRQRVSISLPPPTSNSTREQQTAAATADVAIAQPITKLRHKLIKEKQKKAAAASEQQQQKENRGKTVEPQQRMAFLGSVKLKETAVEFLRGTIGRSKRKAADLGGGGKDAQRTIVGTNNGGNGVCPVPETVTTAPSTACTSSGGTKKTGLVSFSQAGSAKSTRKTVQSVDTCVSDSFDEQMIDKICAIPTNMDQNEWLAAHVLALFEHVNGISCTLSEICTPVTCPVMNYPGNQKAPWIDERGKRHNYAAMRYIDSVMSFCEASRQNQVYFPTKYGTSFTSEFESHCARMVRLLWHCLGHIYSKHWEHIGALNLRPQFGLVLAHLARLSKMYNLLQEKESISLNNTLQLARPTSGVNMQQQRPMKRGLTEDGNNNNNGTGGTTAAFVNPNGVQGRIQQQQRKQQQQQAQQPPNGKEQHQHQHQESKSMAAMKSGSWGGNSAAAVMAAAAAQQANCGTGLLTTNNCQKCYAQTC